jgi:hypothetical protein
MDCPICKKTFKTIRGLMPHIKCHGYDSKKLYDEFKRKENEGFCRCCNKETKYIDYTKGYQQFCSSKCSANITVKEYWNSETERVSQRKNQHRENFKKYQNINGRPKGTKNKKPYPKSDKVLSRKPPSWKGKTHSEETKEKMSNTRSLMLENGEIKIMASYKGKYKPSFPNKYRGDVTSIIYRSLWERKFMVYCDTNENVSEWSSEETVIRYYDPTSKKVRRYFPDFMIKVKEPNGSTKKYVIEIKPKRQTLPPPKPKRQTKGYIAEAYEYAKNQAKWEAAKEWCADRGYEFKVLTENELGIK